MKKVHILAALEDNYIFILIDEDSKTCLIVDPGVSQVCADFLRTNKLKLGGILITHHHPDHTHGVSDLALASNCPIVLTRNSKFIPTSPMKNIQYVSDEDEITISNFRLRIFTTPGHTLDHCIYDLPEENWVFVGDHLFNLGCGRVFEGTMEQMWQSFEKLKAILPAGREIYCTHEYTLKNLKFCGQHFNSPELSDFGDKQIERRKNNSPTVPFLFKTQLELNPFLKCKNSDDFSRIRTLRNSP